MSHCCFSNIQAPVVIVLNIVACADEEAADIAAKIQNLATLPGRPFRVGQKQLNSLSVGARCALPQCQPGPLEPWTALTNAHCDARWRLVDTPFHANDRRATRCTFHTSTVHGTAAGRTPLRFAHACSAQAGVSTSR